MTEFNTCIIELPIPLNFILQHKLKITYKKIEKNMFFSLNLFMVLKVKLNNLILLRIETTPIKKENQNTWNINNNKNLSNIK